jgi:hypothetical protein
MTGLIQSIRPLATEWIEPVLRTPRGPEAHAVEFSKTAVPLAEGDALRGTRSDAMRTSGRTGQYSAMHEGSEGSLQHREGTARRRL